MNILILSDHRGSLDRRIISEANALVKQGFNVTLINTPIEDDYSDVLDKKVNVIIHPPKFFDRKKRRFYKFLLSCLGSSKNFLIEYLKFIKRKKLLRSATEYLVSHTPNQDFDIIHAHDLNTLPAAIKIKEKYKKNAKIIFDAHELYPQQYLLKKEIKFWHKLEEGCLQKVDYLITINPSCTNYFKTTYNYCQPIEVIYNGYNPEKVDNLTITKEHLYKLCNFSKLLPLVIFQGNLSHDRNVVNLVKAFQHLKDKANLVIIGDGSILSTLKNLKKKYQLDNVAFIGWVAQGELPHYLRLADIGIIPYLFNGKLNNYYCTPNKLFEYIACRVPICVNSLPELSRIIEKYSIGKAYELDTSENISKSIVDLLNHLDEFSEQKFEEADKELGWPAQEKTLMNIYASLSGIEYARS